MVNKFARLVGLSLFGALLLTAQQGVMRQYTVSTLPAASSNNNVMAQVRDGVNPTDCGTGGGTFVIVCVSNGTVWQAESAGAAAASTAIIANAATIGTTANKLAKLTGAPSTAVATTTADIAGAMGVVIGGAGTTGSATIQTYGTVSCVFDGATIAGDYVQISTTTAGDCHDSATSYPASGQVIGRVLSTNASAGTYALYIYPTEIRGFAAGTAVKLNATASLTPGSIVDGGCVSAGTITVTGVALGDPVAVGANASLAIGVEPYGKVTSANTVTVEVCNSTGAAVSPGSTTFAATIVH